MNRLRLHALWILLSIALVLAAATAPLSRADEVDTYVQTQMKASHWPGVALAVTRGGSVLKLSAYGFANLEHDVAATPQRNTTCAQALTATG